MLFIKLELKVLWAKHFLGLAIDYVTNKNQRIPVTNYFFWPKTEAWEQLKIELAVKSWIKDDEKIKILNSTSEVMNFWLLNRNKNEFNDLKINFPKVKILRIHP